MTVGRTAAPPKSRSVRAALARATADLPGHEERPQQVAMAELVSNAIKVRQHLVVQAGTGTGKSLAYLVPALLAGKRVVVSTATKALQDQLATRDLPRLAGSWPPGFSWAVLKGRSNYICHQRLSEVFSQGEQLVMADGTEAASTDALGQLGRELKRLWLWVGQGKDGQGPRDLTGDRAELPWEPSDVAWAQVSTTWRECPGASRCPQGQSCFAEKAKRRAAQADVVVVNTHLYATSLAVAEADLLPEHQVVVFDEAHELEDIASGAFGSELGQARLTALARTARAAAGKAPDGANLEDAALALMGALRPLRGQSLAPPLPVPVADALVLLRQRAEALLAAIRPSAPGPDAPSGTGPEQAARLRAQKAASHLLDDVSRLLELPPSHIAWVEGSEHSPMLRVAPIDVAGVLTRTLWEAKGAPTAVLASATIPPHLGERLGLPTGSYQEADVGSPFSYETQALLYCPVHLPDPRNASFEPGMHDELVALIEASEGRALALFTSWRAMQAALPVARARLPWEILAQGDLPKPKLVEKFTQDEHSCLFATMGFWQGLDVPGPSLSLVTIDRLPFSRPDDPLLRARRQALGPRAFELMDLPRAATLLAQGAGRLVRSRQDKGVVAVLDPRLGRANYRWELVRALPPMRRTRHLSEVAAFLAPLRQS